MAGYEQILLGELLFVLLSGRLMRATLKILLSVLL